MNPQVPLLDFIVIFLQLGRFLRNHNVTSLLLAINLAEAIGYQHSRPNVVRSLACFCRGRLAPLAVAFELLEDFRHLRVIE